ncbi:hypothetical protein Tdes44962_MAKER07111, partial [Teratosphaeria destructans]
TSLLFHKRQPHQQQVLNLGPIPFVHHYSILLQTHSTAVASTSLSARRRFLPKAPTSPFPPASLKPVMGLLLSRLLDSPPSVAAADAKTAASPLLNLPTELLLEIFTNVFKHHHLVLYLSSDPFRSLQFDYSIDETRRAMYDYLALWVAIPPLQDLVDQVFFTSIALTFRSTERHGGDENNGKVMYDLHAGSTRAMERWCRKIVVEVEVGDLWFLKGILASASDPGLFGRYDHWVHDAPDGYGYLPRTFAAGVTLQASGTQLNGFHMRQAGVWLYDCRSGSQKCVEASEKRVQEIKEVLQAVVDERGSFSFDVAQSIMALVNGWDWKVEKGLWLVRSFDLYRDVEVIFSYFDRSPLLLRLFQDIQTRKMAPFQLSLKRLIKRDRSPFRFLDLPPEIRNRVYEYVFGDLDLAIALLRRNGYKQRLRRAMRTQLSRSGPQLSLLAVCHQLRQESIRFLSGVISAEFRQPKQLFLLGDDGLAVGSNLKHVATIRTCLQTTRGLVPLVKHLRLGGKDPLHFVQAAEYTSLDIINGVKLALLNNVRILTLQYGDFGIENWPFRFQCNHAWVNSVVWPRIEELRMEGRDAVLRLRRSGHSRWQYWYSGREIPEQ